MISCQVPFLLQKVEEEQESEDVSHRVIEPARFVSSESSGCGFTLLGETEPGHMENLSHRLKVRMVQWKLHAEIFQTFGMTGFSPFSF